MDTTSNALAMTLYYLPSQSPQVQENLRHEILNSLQNEGFDYNILVSLPYLDAVCCESLRLRVALRLSIGYVSAVPEICGG